MTAELAEIRAWLAAASAETWLMEPRRLEAFLASSVHAASAAAYPRARGEDLPFALRDGVAHISISGVLMRSVPWWMRGTATPRVREALAAALEEPRVRSILLRIQSPGGSVSGISELADAIHSARGSKPVHAHAEDVAASAAYWLGSQASRFTAERTAEIGSIGAYRAIVDSSAAFDREGLRVHLVRSGPQKGTGHPGIPVSEAELAHQQSLIDGLTDLFVGAVARGRGVGREAIEPSATGACWLASDALSRGLIDGIEPADAAHAQVTLAGGGGVVPPVQLESTTREDHDMTINAQPAQPAPVAPAAVAGAASPTSAPSSTPAAVPAEAARVLELEARLAAETQRADAAVAKVGALEVQIAAIQRSRKTSEVDAAIAGGRLAPAAAEAWLALVAKTPDTEEGLGELRGMLGKLPRITRPEPIGTGPTDNRDAAAGPAAKLFSPEEIAKARAMGRDPDRLARAAEVADVLVNGKARLKSGQVVNLTDYLDGKQT